MATLVGKQADLTNLLKSLLELEYDAIGAYDSALERLQSAECKVAFERFRRDHQRHTEELDEALRNLFVEPPTHKDVKAVLAQGKVVIGQLVGDTGILIAMRSNEKDTNTAYQRAVKRNDLDPTLRATLERNWEDEQRHRKWIEDHLAAMGSVEPDANLPDEKDVASEEFIAPR